MKKTTIAALGGSLTLALVLTFTLVLPASAQPWADQMPGGNGERNEEIYGECDDESMDQFHEQMGEMGRGMMNGSYGAMHQGEGMHDMGDACDPGMMGDHHRDMHSDGEMGDMHRQIGSHIGNGHHDDMHGTRSMGAVHGSMMGSAD